MTFKRDESFKWVLGTRGIAKANEIIESMNVTRNSCLFDALIVIPANLSKATIFISEDRLLKAIGIRE